MDDRVIRSPLLPGGDLIAAALDREILTLADRGGASGLIGERWADLCAAETERWVGRTCPFVGTRRDPLSVERVVRLDATPEIAATAARRGLQNPDLLLLGRRNGYPAIQAADAKFSIETARAKQVSPDVVTGLLRLGELITDQLGGFAETPELIEGVFLSPDFPLTHAMLRQRRGIVRATVRPDQVILVPASARTFFAPLEGASIMPVLAEVDALPVRLGESLLAALYYFRLARAAIGCWLDATKPLLLLNDRLTVDESAVRAEAERRAPRAESAFELVATWYADVGTVRAERAAVDQVTALPLMSRELRELVTRVAAAEAAEPPSLNQVRRRLGAWYRGQFRDRVGPLPPPVPDFPAMLQELGRIGASLSPALAAQAIRVVLDLIEERSLDAEPASGP